LVLTTAQYRVPPAPNVVELELPLTLGAPPPPTASQSEATAEPLIVALVGASSGPDRLDPESAAALADALTKRADPMRARLTVVLSPRTKADVGKAISTRLSPPHGVAPYRNGPDNPYWRLIHCANEVVVTSDSVSMLADAIDAGKPVYVY